MFHQDWTEFFPNSEQGTKYYTEKQKLIIEDQSYYISFCNFGALITEGAIYYCSAKDTTKALIEDTDFYKCSNTENWGGSLYFFVDGECVQNPICRLNSNSVQGFMYCLVDVSDIAKYKNKILNSSISESGNLYKDRAVNINLVNGEIEINSINISYTDLYICSLFAIWYYNFPSRASFSTFCNNTDTYQDIFNDVYFYNSPETLLIESCNYLSNNLHVIISANNAYVNVVNCNFINNTGREYYFFQGSDGLGNITIDGCYIDESNPKKEGKVYFTNNETNPFKIEFPNLTCEFEIPKSKNEEENEIIYFNRKKRIFKNLHFLFFQSFVIISRKK